MARARAWVKQRLTAEMFNHLVELKNAGLVEPTKLFLDIVTPRDAFAHRDWTVYVHPNFRGGWDVLECNDGGGGIETFSTKREAIDRAMWFAREQNAELHVTHQVFPGDEAWRDYRGF